MKRLSGFTILEVLLGAALTLMFTGIVVYTLVPLLRYSSWTSARAGVGQAASLAGERIGADLQKAPFAGLSLHTEALSIHPVGGVTDTGRTVWADKLVLYRWEPRAGNLTRAVCERPGTAVLEAPVRLTPPQIASALQERTTSRHLLLSGVVKEWSVASSETGVRLRMVTEVPVAGRAAERFELVKDLALRVRSAF